MTSLIETFTTKDIPAVRRLDYWNSVASGFSPGLSIASREDGFSGNLRCLRLGKVKLLWAAASASEITRLAGRDDSERILVHVLNAGRCRQHQRMNDIILAPGDVSLCTTAAPFMQTAAGHEILVLDIERPVFERHIPDFEDNLGKLIPAAVPGAHSFHQLLLAFWREMSSVRHDGSSAILANAEHVLLEMLGVVVRSHQHDGGSLVDSRTIRVNQIIDENLSRSSLSPSFVADRLAVSLRTLQMWFATSGTTPRAYIQRRRLELASVALRNGRGPSITTIAIDHGYSDSAHFARCFHRHFGQSPRAYRKANATKAADTPAIHPSDTPIVS